MARRAEETSDGRTVFHAAFDDYRDGFPHVVDVATADGPGARLTYDAVELNVAIAADVFAPPPAPRVLPLDAVSAEAP